MESGFASAPIVKERMISSPNRSHFGGSCACIFESEVRKKRMLQDSANFGFGTRVHSAPIRIRARAVSAPAECTQSCLGFSWKFHSRIASESVTNRALASNLEVLGRGLAAIGNLFVFDRLSFVERGKTSFLDRRNMNENVLAAT